MKRYFAALALVLGAAPLQAHPPVSSPSLVLSKLDAIEAWEARRT